MNRFTSSQLNFDYGTRLKEVGLQIAVDHADEKEEHWSDQAYKLFKIFLGHRRRGTVFMIEDFRESVKGTLTEPPSKRAFGFIPIRAAKEGLIIKKGTKKVHNAKAHNCFATLWMKL